MCQWMIPARREFAWRAVIFIALLAAAALIVYAIDIFLLAFASVLSAIFLDFLTARLGNTTRLRRGWAFLIVALSISALIALAAWMAYPRIADQVSELIHDLPQALQRFRAFLQSREWGRNFLAYLPQALASLHITATIAGTITGIVDGITALAIIAIISLYLAANPRLYLSGLLSLFPDTNRRRAEDVLCEIAYALRWWFLGQLVPMVVLGMATALGLWLLNVRLAFTLGLFTGFMIFVPYVGAIIAFLVTVTISMMQSTTQALYVTILFVGIHVAEAYLLTPLVQKRAVHIPPALSILSQLLMGLLVGFLGLTLATPLATATLVVVQMVNLGQRPKHHQVLS